MNQSTRTIDGFVVNDNVNSHAFFAYSNSTDREVLIDYNYVSPNVDIFGKWIRAVVHSDYKVCQPIRIIDDVFESRVLNGAPEIRVQVQYKGSEGNVEFYHNDYIGQITDTVRMIGRVDRNSVYKVWITRITPQGTNPRWTISQQQAVVYPMENQRQSNSLRTVEGIIHSDTKNDGYIAWSNSVPRNRIFISDNQCPSNGPILGAWVEMRIDHNDCVQEPIRFLQNLFETRVSNYITEIRVKFKCVQNSPAIFFNEYFGDICDPKFILERKEIGALYEGWIAYHHINVVDSRWRLAINQNIIGPLSVEYPSRQSNYRNRRDSSPDIVNNYDEPVRSVTPQRQSGNNDYRMPHYQENRSNGSSSQPYDRQPRDSHRYTSPRRYEDDIQDNKSFKNDRQGEVDYRRVSRNQSPAGSGYQSPRRRSRTPERFESRRSPLNKHRNDRSPPRNNPVQRQESSSEKSSEEDESRCASSLSTASRGATSASESDNDSETGINTDVPGTSQHNRPKKNMYHKSSKRNNDCVSYAEIMKNLEMPPTKEKLSPEDKKLLCEFKDCNAMVIQIRRLFEFFTSDEKLVLQMKSMGSEQFEHLAEILKK